MGSAVSGRYEREFVNILTGLGYGAVRIPTSGSATDRDLPDVLYAEAVETGPTLDTVYADAYAVEHKSGRATTLYVDEAEVAALRRFCDAFGAEPMLAARYTRQATGKGHYCVRPDDARRTPEGNFGLPLDGIKDRAAMIFHPNE